jgi:hypothetical protein
MPQRIIVLRGQRSIVMPTENAIVVAAIVAAFAIFGLVLAWGEMQTRGIKR